jgi:hypothetical protein
MNRIIRRVQAQISNPDESNRPDVTLFEPVGANDLKGCLGQLFD